MAAEVGQAAASAHRVAGNGSSAGRRSTGGTSGGCRRPEGRGGPGRGAGPQEPPAADRDGR